MGHLKSYLLSHHPAHSVNRCGAMPFPTVGGSIVSLSLFSNRSVAGSSREDSELNSSIDTTLLGFMYEYGNAM
jgi:hypothetical protein